MYPAYHLGNLLDRSLPQDKIALPDCGDRGRPRAYPCGEIDRLANACARVFRLAVADRSTINCAAA